MRNITLSIIYTAGILLLFSCSGGTNSGGKSVIDIESTVGKGAVYNASEFIKSIKYVPLETTPNSMVGNIIDIIVNNNKIYVRDDENVIKIFDLNGRYLHTFDRQGRGPEEYTSFIDFEMTPDGHIYIASMNEGIVEYGPDLKFIRKITPDKGQDAGFIDLIIVKKGVFASNIFSFNINIGLKTLWKIYDDSLNTLFLLNDEPIPIQLPGSGSGEVRAVGTTSRMNHHQSYMFNNDFIMFNPENDTIFNIDYENNYLKSDRYIINYGKYRYSEKIESGSEIEAISLNSLIEADNYLYLAFDFRKLAPEPFERETSMNRAFSSSNASSGSATTTTTISIGAGGGGGTNTTVNAIYNKRSGELSLLNQPIPRTLGLKNNINNGATFWPKSITEKQELISWHNALDLITLAEEGKIDQSIVANLKEDDNPVVVIAVPK